MKYNFMVSIIKDDDWYVASCLENHVASQGKTRDEALANLHEALELYYENFVFVSQKGSHAKYVKKLAGLPTRTAIVPMHDEISKGTLRKILLQAGLTIEEFMSK